MKLLVLGAGGQLGKEFQYLSEEKNLPFEFHFRTEEQLNILDKPQIDQSLQSISPDILINCAAYTAVDMAETNIKLAYAINADAPEVIAQACTKIGCRMIHFSTDYVYHNDKNSPLQESDRTDPKGVYATSKLMGEQKILKVQPEALIFRTSWIYSKFGNNFVKTILRLSQEKESLSVVADQIGTPTWARDLASMVLKMLEKYPQEKIIGGIYNFSNSGVTSWFDFATMICRLANLKLIIHPIPSSEYPTPAVRPPYSILDHQKIKKYFDPEIPFWVDSLVKCLRELLPEGRTISLSHEK